MNKLIERLKKLGEIYDSPGNKSSALALCDEDFKDIEKLRFPELFPSQNSFVVMTVGYWGKGRTISEAAKNCLKEGSSKTEFVLVRCFPDTSDIQHSQIAVDGVGCINYPNGLNLIRIISPADGHKVKLSTIL